MQAPYVHSQARHGTLHSARALSRSLPKRSHLPWAWSAHPPKTTSHHCRNSPIHLFKLREMFTNRISETLDLVRLSDPDFTQARQGSTKDPRNHYISWCSALCLPCNRFWTLPSLKSPRPSRQLQIVRISGPFSRIAIVCSK